jgi:hypothetical protein
MSRRLLAAGEVEVISSRHAAARRPLLNLYLDIERRSWKPTARAGIMRHPDRLAFFESLCEPGQPLELAYDFIALDGVPIGGMVSGIFDGGLHALETAYDNTCADLSPGYLTWLFAIRHGIERGLRSYNLLGSYSYYKTHWNGIVTPTWAVQLYRIPSLQYLKARAGELKRRLRAAHGEPELFNPVKREVEEKTSGGPMTRPPRTAEAELAKRTLSDLELSGAQIERLSGPALREALPFEVETNSEKKKGSG